MSLSVLYNRVSLVKLYYRVYLVILYYRVYLDILYNRVYTDICTVLQGVPGYIIQQRVQVKGYSVPNN